MSRRKRMMQALGVILGMVIVIAWFDSRRTITWENFPRIKEGMTREQVESLLGGPPGDYSSFSLRLHKLVDGAGEKVHGEDGRLLWASGKSRYWVWFDEEGRVARKQADGIHNALTPWRDLFLLRRIRE